AAKHFGAVDIEGGQVRPGAAALVFVLDAHGHAGLRRQRRVFTRPRLNAGLLVGGQHELVITQQLPLPPPLVKIEDAPGLDGKLGIAGKDPAAMLPRPNRIRIEPAPDGAVADGRDQPQLPRLLRHVGHTEARQRQAERCRQFTRQRLDLHHHVWGKKPGVGPGEPDRPIPAGVVRKSACATGSRFRGAYAGTKQSRHCPNHRRRGGSSWPGRLDNTVTYISSRAGTVLGPRLATAQSDTDFSLAWRTSARINMPQETLKGNINIRSRIYETRYLASAVCVAIVSGPVAFSLSM